MIDLAESLFLFKMGNEEENNTKSGPALQTGVKLNYCLKLLRSFDGANEKLFEFIENANMALDMADPTC